MYFANSDKLLSVNMEQRKRLLSAYVEARKALDKYAGTRIKPMGINTTKIQAENNDVACSAAKEYLQKVESNATIYYLGPSKSGETNEIAREMAGLLRKIADGKHHKYSAPCYVIQGYVDTTIKMGVELTFGGKSIHQALVMMDELGGDARIAGICVKTNWDGNTCATGGMFDYYAWASYSRTGSAKEMMKSNESFAIMKGIKAAVEVKRVEREKPEKARIMIAEVHRR